MKQARRTYNLKMFTPKEEQVFTKFQKVITFNGETVRDSLLQFMEGYLADNPVKVKLMTETELLDEAAKQGLKTNKALLIKHRKQGTLDGFWFTNQDGRIVYNSTPVLKFFKGRQGRGSGTWTRRADGESTAA